MAVQNNKGRRIALFMLLLAAVVAIHLIVLALFFWKKDQTKSPETDDAEKTEERTEGTPAPKSNVPAWISPDAADAPSAPVQKKSASVQKKTERPRPKQKLFHATAKIAVGKPFSKQGCVRQLPKSVPFSTGMRSGILVDLNTRRVLWEKDPEKPVPVASMVKMMTMLLTLEKIDASPDLSLETPVPIPKYKYPKEGIAWLDPRETFTVEELLKMVVVKSANDAAIVLALRVGGSVPEFVGQMNRRAAALGMSRTKFNSPCGLPEKRVESYSSARDMVVLGEQLLNYPVVREWCLMKTLSIRDGRTLFTTTNNLINPHYPGVDGLKTGYTNAAGACLTFTAERNGRRLMGCVTGFKRAKAERDPFCRKVLDWGFQQAEALEKGKSRK